MITKLFGGRHKRNALAAGVRVYAIGDIHGRADLLDDLLGKIRSDIADNPGARPILVFLGDYIDRGEQSPLVIDRLLELADSEMETVFLKGNHEVCLIRFLMDPVEHYSWLEWGGDETLRSYGLDRISARDPLDLAAALKNAMPARHLTFLQGLDVDFQSGDYYFVHAGLRPGVPLAEQSEHDKMWIRDEFHNTPENLRPDFTVVHGHQSSKKVIDKGWRVCVDTGAVWNDTLTAVVIEGDKRRFLST